LKVFENRVLRRIFGPKRDEVKGVWRKIHNEELNNLYSSPISVRVILIEKNGMGGTCSSGGEVEKHVQGFVGKPEGKRPLGRLRRRWRIILRWIFKK
jgi:hypothetical protein